VNGPPSLDLADGRLRPVTPDDAAAVAALADCAVNVPCHGLLPMTAEVGAGFLAALGQGMWSTPMLAERGARPAAFLGLANVDPRDMSANLIALLSDELPPSAAGPAIQRYIETVFWLYPLERIARAVLAGGTRYAAALTAAGFASEGVVTGMARRGGERVDVEFLSALRPLGPGRVA
jgi:hypothetical protein